jgi:hypothetical protein
MFDFLSYLAPTVAHMSDTQPDHADQPEFSEHLPRSPYTDAMTDVESPPRSPIAVEQIAEAIAQIWRHEGDTTVEMLTPTAVYIVERKLVEWAFEDTNSAAERSDLFDQIRKRGIDVGIVLPMPELGRAHEEFWGTGLILYGWIDRGDNVVRFTGPEVA